MRDELVEAMVEASRDAMRGRMWHRLPDEECVAMARVVEADVLRRVRASIKALPRTASGQAVFDSSVWNVRLADALAAVDAAEEEKP